MQYPDRVIVTRSVLVQDENGNFSKTEKQVFASACRAEPSGVDPTIRLKDGSVLYYSWIIYLPKTGFVFTFGDNVLLEKADGSEYDVSVLRHYNGLLNSRIWV